MLLVTAFAYLVCLVHNSLVDGNNSLVDGRQLTYCDFGFDPRVLPWCIYCPSTRGNVVQGIIFNLIYMPNRS